MFCVHGALCSVLCNPHEIKGSLRAVRINVVGLFDSNDEAILNTLHELIASLHFPNSLNLHTF